MSDFKIHDAKSAREAARDTVKKVKEKFGFVPNLMRTLAASPPALKAYVTVSGLLEQTPFSPVNQTFAWKKAG